MYKVLLSKNVEKVLNKIRKSNIRIFNQIMRALEKISEDPYSAKPLVGILKNYYSYRVRDYRIIFDIVRRKHIVHIEKIEHRKDVYR